MMIPTVTLSPEFYLTSPTNLACFHVIDEKGKTIGVVTKQHFTETVEMFMMTEARNIAQKLSKNR